MSNVEPLVAPWFLFRLSLPVPRLAALDKGPPEAGLRLAPEHRLTSYEQLEGLPCPADVRAAWGVQGLCLQVEVAGKSTSLWCRESKVEDSDGLQVLVDTRDTKSVHRAGRFQHSFFFLPQSAGGANSEPAAVPVAIPRARELPAPAPSGSLRCRSSIGKAGYRMTCFIGAEALTGWDPDEHRRIGLAYVLRDRELGQQSFPLDDAFPVTSDPSLWGSIDLLD